MKFHETHFEEYISSVETYDLHPELNELRNKFPPSITQIGNLIVYGPSGVGKYSQVLYFIKKYSPSELKYDKRITLQNEKQVFIYRISDIHYEIDMEMLGCNAKIIWHDVFQQIVDIISLKPDHAGIIICKNFHKIHKELLDIFYSYIQQYNHPSLNIQLKFILITEHISFIPNSILNSCRIVPVDRPSRDSYDKMIKTWNFNQLVDVEPVTIPENINENDILNIKEIFMCSILKDGDEPPKEIFNMVCDAIIKEMMNPKKMVIAEFRDYIYDILIYNLDATECIWYILTEIIQSGAIGDKSVPEILEKLHSFLKQYNNNYRPIYHLESILFYIINRIHGYPEIKL